MDRKAFDNLKQWKNRANRKPLVIQGARQVGKTWLMREFGRREYARTAYLSFADSPQAAAIFESTYRVSDIVQGIARYAPVCAVRTSLAAFEKNGDMLNLPLYALSRLQHLLQQ